MGFDPGLRWGAVTDAAVRPFLVVVSPVMLMRTRVTKNNGITEGFHRKMKLIQRRAWGRRWSSNVPVASRPSLIWLEVARSASTPANGPMTPPWPCVSLPAWLNAAGSTPKIKWNAMSAGGKKVISHRLGGALISVLRSRRRCANSWITAIPTPHSRRQEHINHFSVH